ncbi:hypothetical protein C1645_769796 [Glomus cerebriforme]|uniref:Uncharacterized protein n=1 Tax=Glomus cerebriforme TaxID=658196 RepID=A0A397SWH0_9GLOM|nr:hypothetical protein C1645_769796 [Glomus cerebriforme]
MMLFSFNLRDSPRMIYHVTAAASIVMRTLKLYSHIQYVRIYGNLYYSKQIMNFLKKKIRQ